LPQVDGLALPSEETPMQPTDPLVPRLKVDTYLSEEDTAAVRALPISTKDVPRDTYIVREGDIPSCSCLVIKGFACRSKVTDSGNRQILSFHIPGDTLIWKACF
jgi:CRP-like cAMP-binding protein